jgi:hypothetical protein
MRIWMRRTSSAAALGLSLEIQSNIPSRYGRRIHERQSSFTETPAKPLVELFQRQFPSVRIGAPAPDFLDLLISQPLDAFVLRFH